MQGVCDVIKLLPPHQIHPMRLQCYIINIKSACRAGFIKSGISHLTQSQVCAQSSQNPLEFLNVYFDGILNPKLFPGKTFLLQFQGVILSDIQISIQQKYGLWFKYINILLVQFADIFTFFVRKIVLYLVQVNLFIQHLGCHLSWGMTMIAFAHLIGGILGLSQASLFMLYEG